MVIHGVTVRKLQLIDQDEAARSVGEGHTPESGLGLEFRLSLEVGLGLGLEEVFVFDSKSENRDRAVEAVESVSEARAV